MNKNDPMLVFAILIPSVLILFSLSFDFKRMYNAIKSRKLGTTNYDSLEDAGMSQWKDFTLTSTPDMIKKGVTDISKYYI
jgi:hypothetical protein